MYCTSVKSGEHVYMCIYISCASCELSKLPQRSEMHGIFVACLPGFIELVMAPLCM